ncbi:hypothetical protein OH809_23315 [Streptomyces sp. NBC_00873]|uniref:hypothetical protein n=1 Tax=unclassified Streptomyces TaxID=2593676 RepID=UPI00386D6AE8|nr:hypothetical protein OH809_23315 [Streptomyces sp. NBC_00873]WTA44620.1 hypothetical protein OH821_19980 [Streptomyces sp. NBC_00842]
MAAAEAVGATVVTAPVVFGVRGVPRDEGEWWCLALLAAFSAVNGVLACTRLRWLGGEKREFEDAVPLANPDSVLPTPRESFRRSFDWGFVVFAMLFGLVFSLIWVPVMALWSLLFLPERLIKGAYGIYWERRHGVLLWRGRVPEQPLGKGQYLYSSVRQPGTA